MVARSQTVLASAERTTDTVSPSQRAPLNAKGAHITIDVTAIETNPSITPKVQALDPVSGQWYTMMTNTAISATSTAVMRVYPGIAVTSTNSEKSDVLPRNWRLNLAHGNTNKITYSVGVSYVN